ncbi:MAG: alpha/beta hydrolase [Myxococcota bacterium]
MIEDTMNEHPLHTHIAGPEQGRIALLLHSSGFSSRQWRPYLPALHGAGWQTMTVDLFGYGDSPAWTGQGAFHFRHDVDAVLDLLRGLSGELAVVGHSYGGLVGLQALIRPTCPPARAVVYEPVVWGILASDGTDEERAELGRLEASGFFDDATGGSREWMEQFVTFWNGAGAWDALGERGQAQMMCSGRKTFEEVRSLCRDTTPAKAYAALREPVHVISGHMSPPAIRHACALLANAAAHHTIDMISAGHMGPVTHTEQVIEHVVGRLGRAQG